MDINVKLISKPRHLLSNDYPWVKKWSKVQCLNFIRWQKKFRQSARFYNIQFCSKCLKQLGCSIITIVRLTSNNQPSNRQSVRFTVVKCLHLDLADLSIVCISICERQKFYNYPSYVWNSPNMYTELLSWNFLCPSLINFGQNLL